MFLDQSSPCATATHYNHEVNNLLVNEHGEVSDILGYDRYICFFSGGKDSIASFLSLLEAGVPISKIELHHHLVDGREGSTLMDWPVTESYCQAFAKAFNVKFYASWKVGGFEREMLRNGDRTAPISFESEDGTLKTIGGTGGKEGVRRKFPQVSADLSVRYCSSYMKIDCGARILANEPRFLTGKTLVVTGERAEESTSRANYKVFEPHRCDNRNGTKVIRHIDHLRPVHTWLEHQVWQIMERFNVNPHPAYWLGFGRVSCRTCIFASANQWATIRLYMPNAFKPIQNYEAEFGFTIQRSKTVGQLADSGTPYRCGHEMLTLAESTDYYESIFVDNWVLPSGAFKETNGPT